MFSNYYSGYCKNEIKMNTVQFGQLRFIKFTAWVKLLTVEHTMQKQHLWNPLWTDFRDNRQETVSFSALPTANCSTWTMILTNTGFCMSRQHVDATTSIYTIIFFLVISDVKRYAVLQHHFYIIVPDVNINNDCIESMQWVKNLIYTRVKK